MTNKILKSASRVLRRFLPSARKKKPVVLPAIRKDRGCVAISYITWPFREGWDSPKARGHTNAFEVVAMAEAWRDQGFRVEVCDHDDKTFKPPADCRVAIDIHGNLERWGRDLPHGCIKILHATGPHWLESNQAELAGLASIRDRKGIALRPRRQVEPSRGVEAADHVVVLGNEYTADSFAFGGKPVTRVPISSAYEFEWPEHRDFEQAKRNFFWVASYGMVHKGLDLVLDAFAGLPDLQLTVCGRPEKEHDFFNLYRRELQDTQNIGSRGWIDMTTAAFAEIARTHATIIYPSKAEGGAGSAIHCMHAGMLPACTRGASIDLGDFGISIPEETVDSVCQAALQVAAMTAAEVEQRARRAWEHVRRVHTREEFRKNYANFAQSIAAGLG